MVIDVHMLAFMDKGSVRKVDIPDAEIKGLSIEDGLEKVYHYGQNDFCMSPRHEKPSVSVGDVIEYSPGDYWMVAPFGFKQISREKFDSLDGNISRNPNVIKELYT